METDQMKPIGLDIGGANLKGANGTVAISRPFPMWKEPQRLTDELRDLLHSFPEQAPLAVTMTGELADCFTTKDEGVQFILSAVEQAADRRQVGIWQTGGEFVSLDDARYLPSLVAAANWHALATWAGRMCPHGQSLIIDVGSTTTDIIPIEQGLPLPAGRTDLERLGSGELLYLGVRRTPLCSLASHVKWREQRTSLARELFATTHDLHMILEMMPEEPENSETANGRPATLAHAQMRLARLLCSDRNELSNEDLREIAQSLFDSERELVVNALKQAWPLPAPPDCLLLSGEGEFLIRHVLRMPEIGWNNVETLSLRELLGETFSQSACAEALSRLAAEVPDFAFAD